MRLTVADDAAHAAQLAAGLLARLCVEAVAARNRAVVALSGGSTPWAMLRLWVGMDLPWRQVWVAQVDERCVPRGDPRRNLDSLQAILVERGPLPAAQLLAMPVEEADLGAAARRYERMLSDATHGGARRLDVVQLGLGSDGHTASLVPGDAALEVDDRDVTLTDGTYQGTRRMTLTYRALDAARDRLWLVTGEGKRAALAELVRGTGGAPAVAVRRTDTVVVADRAAADDSLAAG